MSRLNGVLKFGFGDRLAINPNFHHRYISNYPNIPAPSCVEKIIVNNGKFYYKLFTLREVFPEEHLIFSYHGNSNIHKKQEKEFCNAFKFFPGTFVRLSSNENTAYRILELSIERTNSSVIRARLGNGYLYPISNLILI